MCIRDQEQVFVGTIDGFLGRCSRVLSFTPTPGPSMLGVCVYTVTLYRVSGLKPSKQLLLSEPLTVIS